MLTDNSWKLNLVLPQKNFSDFNTMLTDNSWKLNLVLPQKNCSDFNTMLTDKSWKVRKEALDALLPLATENLKIVPSSE